MRILILENVLNEKSTEPFSYDLIISPAHEEREFLTLSLNKEEEESLVVVVAMPTFGCINHATICRSVCLCVWSLNK